MNRSYNISNRSRLVGKGNSSSTLVEYNKKYNIIVFRGGLVVVEDKIQKKKGKKNNNNNNRDKTRMAYICMYIYIFSEVSKKKKKGASKKNINTI